MQLTAWPMLHKVQPATPALAFSTEYGTSPEIVEAAVRQGGLSSVSLRMPWVQSSETFAAQVGPRRNTAKAVRDLWGYIDARDAAQGIGLALG